MIGNRCPTCNSPQPHLHPATQHEGEAQPCGDAYHDTLTPSNTTARIADTQQLLRRLTQ